MAKELLTGMVVEVVEPFDCNLTAGDWGYVSRGMDKPLKGDGMFPPIVVMQPLIPMRWCLPIYNSETLVESVRDGALRVLPGKSVEDYEIYGQKRREHFYTLQDRYVLFDGALDMRRKSDRDKLDQSLFELICELPGITPHQIHENFVDHRSGDRRLSKAALDSSLGRLSMTGKLMPTESWNHKLIPS